MIDFYFFRKYVPTVKTMNESMNESMKKMAVTQVDKNEFFLTKRTHNKGSHGVSRVSGKHRLLAFVVSVVSATLHQIAIPILLILVY